MSNPVFCCYHRADLDGKCAGAIVKDRFKDAVMIGVDYHDDFDKALAPIPDGATVYLVDFTFYNGRDIHWMVDLAARCHLIWCDHHKEALALAASVGFECAGLREIGRAGCELTWVHLWPEVEIPVAVRLLGRYDVWDHSDEETWTRVILPFQYGMRMQPSDPDSDIWALLFDDDESGPDRDGLIEIGRAILAYQSEQDSGAMKNAFATTLRILNPGADKVFRAIACNTTRNVSTAFDSVWDPEKYDVMMPFTMLADGKWKVSLYSTKPDIDCGEIAQLYGGGGHKGAAGFTHAYLPFKTGAER